MANDNIISKNSPLFSENNDHIELLVDDSPDPVQNSQTNDAITNPQAEEVQIVPNPTSAAIATTTNFNNGYANEQFSLNGDTSTSSIWLPNGAGIPTLTVPMNAGSSIKMGDVVMVQVTDTTTNKVYSVPTVANDNGGRHITAGGGGGKKEGWAVKKKRSW